MIFNLSIYRKEYIYKIKERLYIYNTIFYFDSKYIFIHQKLLAGLTHYNVIKKYIIRVKKNKDYYSDSVLILHNKLISNIYVFNISKHFYHVILINTEYYSVSSFINIHKIVRISSNMIKKDIDLSGVIKANKICFYLDKYLYDINMNIINDELHKLYNKLSCNTFEEYLSKYFYIIDKLYFCKHKTLEQIEEQKNFLKYYKKIIFLLVLTNINLYNKKFYMPCFCDNRGRQYYMSLLSPTFNVCARSLLMCNENKQILNNLESSMFYKKIIQYSHLINNYPIHTDFNKYIFIILLIELGKLFSKTNNDCYISTETFILDGIYHYNNQENDLKFKDKILFNIAIQNINDFFNNKLNYNRMLIKDATASGLQNFGILCGYKLNKLKYMNLDGDYWYDTYQYFINLYVDDYNYKNRKYWKKTLMTIKYNATWFSCFEYFKDALLEDNINYWHLNNNEQQYLMNLHRTFYNNVKKHITNELYEYSEMNIDNLINFEYTKKTLISSKEYKINYKTHRDKYTYNEYAISYDDKSSKISLEANNMHYLDALLVKNILIKYNVITIHDCFCIQIYDLHNVIDSINEYYSNYIGNNKYSIHIIK